MDNQLQLTDRLSNIINSLHFLFALYLSKWIVLDTIPDCTIVWQSKLLWYAVS